MKFKNLAAFAVSIAAVATMSGCAAASDKEEIKQDNNITESLPPEQVPPVTELPPEQVPPEEEAPSAPVVKPEVKTAAYISVTADGVNLRTGAGTNYTVVGSAEKNTLYSLLGEENGWYMTKYRDKTVYLSKKYCVTVDLPSSGNKTVEAVIAEGSKFLGVPYVYGATRLHDGKGNMLKDFTTAKFDCSSLMQYIFYKGAGQLLDVTTRTQVVQGATVKKSDLRRGDLMFFTNATRKDKVGIERIGHVALYLGGNYILHTASDYAKIEQISQTRWGYYIQSQRII